MPGENSTQPASAAAPAAAVVTAPAASAAPVTAPAAPATAAAPSPILGADPKAPAQPATEKPAAAAPTDIKYEFKLPEGKQLDQTQLDAYTPVFQKHKVSAELAQELVDTSIKLADAQAEAANKKLGDDIAAETAAWAKASREDKEFGGTNFDANAKIANQALAAFGSPELKTELVNSGYANHPAFVRFFWNVGQKLGESAAPADGKPSGSKTTPERVLYPSMNS